MQGYQITFFTQQDHHIDKTPVSEWLLQAARKLGIRGGTVVAASLGLGHHGRFHSAHFFELADQPQEIIFAVTQEEADMLFTLLAEQKGRIFYVKTPIEFGAIGRDINF